MSVSLFKYYGAGGNCLEAKKGTLQHNKFLTCKPLGKSLFIITSWFTELRMPVSTRAMKKYLINQQEKQLTFHESALCIFNSSSSANRKQPFEAYDCFG